MNNLFIIALISIVTGLAVASFRGESPAQLLERASLEFRAYCAGVRYRAAEEGREWGVYFNPETRTFSARAILSAEELDEQELSGGEETGPAATLTWQIPAKLEFGDGDPAGDFGGEEEESEGTKLARQLEEEESELFADSDEETDPAEEELGRRVMVFHSDGSAGSGFRLVFHCGELRRVFAVSPLSGALITVNEEEEMPE